QSLASKFAGADQTTSEEQEVGRGQLCLPACQKPLNHKGSWHGYRIMSLSIRIFSNCCVKSASKGEIDVAESKRIDGHFFRCADFT
ncbi:hypothetical protein, partial [Mesorhizobium sp.]|uniref:hypothetical protein n=1 Tax=Mesorhizobium sp. TaxID=1871066 RepID=UPI00257C5E91